MEDHAQFTLTAPIDKLSWKLNKKKWDRVCYCIPSITGLSNTLTKIEDKCLCGIKVCCFHFLNGNVYSFSLPLPNILNNHQNVMNSSALESLDDPLLTLCSPEPKLTLYSNTADFI